MTAEEEEEEEEKEEEEEEEGEEGKNTDILLSFFRVTDTKRRYGRSPMSGRASYYSIYISRFHCTKFPLFFLKSASTVA